MIGLDYRCAEATTTRFRAFVPSTGGCPAFQGKPSTREPSWLLRSHPESSSTDGDPAVQEKLVRMMRMGIGKEKLKEDVRRVVAEESEKLRRATEEAKMDVDKLEKLMRDRTSLEFGSALADVNKSADDFEEQLRASRAEMESRQAEFTAWEQQVAQQRNIGQFFKGLYQADKDPKDAEDKGFPPDEKRTFQQVESISKTTKMEVSSPVRVYVFFFLALNLSGLTLADLLSKEPSYLLDALYASLAIILGCTAWSERRLVLPAASQTRRR